MDDGIALTNGMTMMLIGLFLIVKIIMTDKINKYPDEKKKATTTLRKPYPKSNFHQDTSTRYMHRYYPLFCHVRI
jgi:hypothetical protein